MNTKSNSQLSTQDDYSKQDCMSNLPTTSARISRYPEGFEGWPVVAQDGMRYLLYAALVQVAVAAISCTDILHTHTPKPLRTVASMPNSVPDEKSLQLTVDNSISFPDKSK